MGRRGAFQGRDWLVFSFLDFLSRRLTFPALRVECHERGREGSRRGSPRPRSWETKLRSTDKKGGVTVSGHRSHPHYFLRAPRAGGAWRCLESKRVFKSWGSHFVFSPLFPFS